MGLEDTSALEAMTRALNSAPNAQIDPKIWTELSRIHSALKEMAFVTDLVNNPPGGDYGGVPVHNYLQEQTRITARATYNILAGTPVRLEYSDGELKAFLCYYGSSPTIFTRCDAAAEHDVANGALGEFVLRGTIVGYNVQSVTSEALNTYHSRVYARGISGSSNFTCSWGSGDRDLAVAGVFLHAYAVDTLSTILMYFNPERTWLDKPFTL
jgi:hypothetical protein